MGYRGVLLCISVVHYAPKFIMRCQQHHIRLLFKQRLGVQGLQERATNCWMESQNRLAKHIRSLTCLSCCLGVVCITQVWLHPTWVTFPKTGQGDAADEGQDQEHICPQAPPQNDKQQRPEAPSGSSRYLDVRVSVGHDQHRNSIRTSAPRNLFEPVPGSCCARKSNVRCNLVPFVSRLRPLEKQEWGNDRDSFAEMRCSLLLQSWG